MINYSKKGVLSGLLERLDNGLNPKHMDPIDVAMEECDKM
jgi:hypothetical protein